MHLTEKLQMLIGNMPWAMESFTCGKTESEAEAQGGT